MLVYLFKGNVYFDQWASFLSGKSVPIVIHDTPFSHDISLSDAAGVIVCERGGFQFRRSVCQIIKACESRNIPVYPTSRALELYDDKVTQAYEFHRLGIPSPDNFVFWEEKEAHQWVENAKYPLVTKTSSGAGSGGVKLIRDKEAAHSAIKRVFRRGIRTDNYPPEIKHKHLRSFMRWLLSETFISHFDWAQQILHSHSTLGSNALRERECILFQEYLHNNTFDFRITVIGDRVFGMRRFNRQGDFRASGSNEHDYCEEDIPEDVIQLAFAAAERLGMKQSMAADILMNSRNEPCIVEVSYDFANAMNSYPGYWDKDLRWNPGTISRFAALAEDFISRLSSES